MAVAVMQRQQQPADELSWPDPRRSRPSLRELCEWMTDGYAEATDGCSVGSNGICEHGYPSWLIYLFLV